MMYIKVDKKLLTEFQKQTITDYEAVDYLIEDNTNYCMLPDDSVDCILEDALHEIERLEEKICELQEHINQLEDRPFNPYTEFGLNEKDFY